MAAPQKILGPDEARKAWAKISSFSQAREAKKRWVHKRQERARLTDERLSHPGRPASRPHGGWITDIGEKKQCILLCSSCQHKFDPRQYSYYRTKEFSVHGRCDACKEYTPIAHTTFFIHESLLGRKHGQCWMPR